MVSMMFTKTDEQGMSELPAEKELKKKNVANTLIKLSREQYWKLLQLFWNPWEVLLVFLLLFLYKLLQYLTTDKMFKNNFQCSI